MSLVEHFRNGLWRDNPGLVQLLGLCPPLAVTTTFATGFGLGIATLSVLVVSNGLVSATRRWIRTEIRIPIYVLIIASLVTCTELVFKAWFPALDRSLGIFIPLIVTNCAIVARAEIFASRNPIVPSIVDGFVMGTGFALLLMVLGAFREVVSMVWLLALLLRAVHDLQTSGTIGADAAVGITGHVESTVPGHRAGRGRVRVVISNRQRAFDAVTDGEALPTNTRVLVTRVDGDNVLAVDEA